MAYNPNARLVQAIRTRVPRSLQPILLATALVESGGKLNAVGDHGQSFGPYQEYTFGRGAGLSPAQREDPVGSTLRALKEFQSFYAKGARGPALAYRAQRPADQAGYEKSIAAALPAAMQILGSGGPSSADPGAVSAAAPGSSYPPIAGNFDATRLYGILNAQTQRALAGEMPSPNYRSELAKLVSQALAGSKVQGTAQGVGRAVGGVAAQVAPGAGGADDGGARYGTPFGTSFTLPALPREVAPVRSTGTVENPKGQPVEITTFDGKPVSAWWASMLTFARAHGWKGSVNSGYRSVAEQKKLFAAHPDPKWVAHPGSSPHNYAMAVDISDGPGLEKVIRAYHLPIARYAPEGWHFEPLGFRTNGTQKTF